MRRHGTISSYIKDRCRCDECREVANAAQRRRRAASRPPSRRYPAGTPSREEDIAWQENAACATSSLVTFFPRSPNYGRAKAVCAGCPVRVACLSYALRTDQPDGVWGGLSFEERQRVIRKRKRSA